MNNNKTIWQGTMFDALQHTLKQEGIYTVDLDQDPKDAGFKAYLRCNDNVYTVYYDDGTNYQGMEMSLLMADACLYRQSPDYELREMSLLAAMAYAQAHELPWMEANSLPGLKFRQHPSGWSIQVRRDYDWQQGFYAPDDVLTWRIPTDTEWLPLTVAEVEALEVQDVRL